MMGDHLGPGTGSEPDNQHFGRMRMKTADRKRTKNPVGVVHQIRVEAAIVDAPSKNDAVRGGRNHSAAGLDHLAESRYRRYDCIVRHHIVEDVNERWVTK